MKIAVAYENGAVFQHFGHTEQFKVYQVEGERVVSSEIVNAVGSGHDALADFLNDLDVDVVICGGIGGGAQEALSGCGIEICSGVFGDADEAVEEFINGELESAGVNCDHHGEGHSCGCGEEDGDEECGCGGCGGGCGGCHGGCGTPVPIMEGKNVGKVVRTHYTGTFNDGTVFDSSYDRGEPLEFTCGVGMMITGYDACVANMEVGEVKEIHLMPSEAYGEINPDAIFTLEIEKLPGSEELTVGQQVYLQNAYGQPFPVTVTAKDDIHITFDSNHEMAGKELNFKIELVEIL